MSKFNYELAELTVEIASLKPGQTWIGLIQPKYAEATVQHFQSLGFGVKEELEHTEGRDVSWILITKRKCQF